MHQIKDLENLNTGPMAFTPKSWRYWMILGWHEGSRMKDTQSSGELIRADLAALKNGGYLERFARPIDRLEAREDFRAGQSPVRRCWISPGYLLQSGSRQAPDSPVHFERR